MSRIHIPPDDPLTLEIIKLYDSGMDLAAIGKKVFLSVPAVKNRLRKAGVQLKYSHPPRKRISQEKIELICGLRKRGWSYGKIAREVGVSVTSVSKYYRKI